MLSEEIINKYNVSSPRYTSYPTILDWNRMEFSELEFKPEFIKSEQNKNHSTSVYVHLPFCESLCTFCGCHKHITKQHSVEAPYIDAVIKEWQMYEKLNGEAIQVDEIHLGGGTPTFFAAEQLKRLIEAIKVKTGPDPLFSIEGHPNHTSDEQLKVLSDLGFRRVSFGVQSYSPIVQKAINRIQPYEQVEKVTIASRKAGFTSISHDLVFGLPMQTMEDMMDTIDKTIHLKPDAISLYSYAHVPWVKGTGQRGFSEEDLPSGDEKRALYEKSKERLLEEGYVEIGMDHFALPSDMLAVALKEGRLNRTFMGYTTNITDRMIGLGASAISSYPFGYAQNIKSTRGYHGKIDANELPIVKGHIHTQTDAILKDHVTQLMCQFKTTFADDDWMKAHVMSFKEEINDFQKDGIIEWNENEIVVTEDGKPFSRNVCMTLDPHANKMPSKGRFSKSV
ncbi:oxygen-independent coproporphyrinogen III oxidase [Brumimicrobium salinarum]|uniref:Coproporphyrinogen-III oxidase n=1 Tax=Brumimicrobium salinarum TaxID=2058658 RepID=A0A2I0QZP1_9FLAO|nr:oxygen-independent coproporphyrinogen III oxidase [Brumimicrobium salinarum]PKR79777.1 oxygen-independent coproporphyrinogen III oxidase [Brumimicrobium salinarum]